MTKSDMLFIIKEYDNMLYEAVCNELNIAYGEGYDKGYRIGYNDGLNHSWCRYSND